MSKSLLRKINQKNIKIAVIGQGYVGLPLALSFAKAGFSVFGIDSDADRISKLLNKKSYITDVPNSDIEKQVSTHRFTPTADFAVVKDCQAVLICVPTPIRRRYTPDISFMLSAVRSVARNMTRGTLVVLESTTYPGTTEELMCPELEKSGFKAGKDFFLAFSPERVDPGNASHSVTNIPKVVGGLTRHCSELTAALYGKIIPQLHIVSSPKAAEMAKLLENTFRIVNIGWINEAAMMCHKFGIDVWEVIDAAKTKPFGFMAFYPGLGVGGHCIPEDPIYLYWKARQKGYASRFIKLSADINAAMPDYVVIRLKDILKLEHKSLKGSRILVLGVTYKKDVKDLRKSPSIKLIEALQKDGVNADFYDPLVPYLAINGMKLEGICLTARNIKSYDVVVVAVDHSKMDYRLVLKSSKMIFDVKNVFKKTYSKKIIRL